MYIYLSWTDLRAFAAVANATARMNEKSSVGEGGNGCDRLCHGQEMRSEFSKCCDTLFLPSIVFRNIERIPQDRVQPYSIKARENGVVTWRVEVRWKTFFCRSEIPASPVTFSFDQRPPPHQTKTNEKKTDARRGLHFDDLHRLPL